MELLVGAFVLFLLAVIIVKLFAKKKIIPKELDPLGFSNLFGVYNNDVDGENKGIEYKLLSNECKIIYDEGLNLYNKDKFLDSIPLFDKCIQDEPRYYLAYHYRGLSHFCLRHYELALKDWLFIRNKLPEIDSEILCNIEEVKKLISNTRVY